VVHSLGRKQRERFSHLASNRKLYLLRDGRLVAWHHLRQWAQRKRQYFQQPSPKMRSVNHQVKSMARFRVSESMLVVAQFHHYAKRSTSLQRTRMQPSHDLHLGGEEVAYLEKRFHARQTARPEK